MQKLAESPVRSVSVGGGKVDAWYKSCSTVRTLSYGNYGIVLIMSNAGFISSTKSLLMEKRSSSGAISML